MLIAHKQTNEQTNCKSHVLLLRPVKVQLQFNQHTLQILGTQAQLENYPIPGDCLGDNNLAAH